VQEEVVASTTSQCSHGLEATSENAYTGRSIEDNENGCKRGASRMARVRQGQIVGKGFKPKRHSKEPRERINCPRRVLEETEVKKSQSGREGRRKGGDSWSAERSWRRWFPVGEPGKLL
jgi:hypothetical protein